MNLPELQIEFISPRGGIPLANGGEKGRAQQQYLKFIEPIIVANIDLPYSEYMRLRSTTRAPTRWWERRAPNGSIRFENSTLENAICKKAFASIEKIKKAVDATVNQPISYADLIAIVPHFAARIQFAKDYYEVMGGTTELRVPLHRHQPLPRRQDAHRTQGRRRTRPRGSRPRRGRQHRGPRRVV